MMTEVQWKDAAGQWKKLHTPPGLNIDEPTFAFQQCKQSGLITRCVKYKPDGSLEVTHGPFTIQRK